MTATLLLLHGFTGSREAWSGLIPALQVHWHVEAVDLPGHGSNPEPASVEVTADQLGAALEGERVHVLGYSLGARVALALAVAHPDVVDRLVLESPSAGIADEVEREARRQADEELAARLEGDGIEAFVDRWERSPVFKSHAALDATVAARQRAIRLGQDPRGLAGSLRLAGQGAMQPLHGRLGDIPAKTLVIAGAVDPARARAERVAAGIPHARIAVIDGAGHTPHLERPDAFGRLVIQFLQEDAT